MREDRTGQLWETLTVMRPRRWKLFLHVGYGTSRWTSLTAHLLADLETGEVIERAMFVLDDPVPSLASQEWRRVL